MICTGIEYYGEEEIIEALFAEIDKILVERKIN